MTRRNERPFVGRRPGRARPNTAGKDVLLALGIALFFGLGPLVAVAPAEVVTDVTYTLDAHFDQGILLNVNHDDVHDQLQLNHMPPLVSMAASGRGTMERIDANSGVILGEYLTYPRGMCGNPSRTTVDGRGNVWVTNRGEYGCPGVLSGDTHHCESDCPSRVDCKVYYSCSGGQEPKGSIVRVGLVVGGTRVDADGTPNPQGQYLKPPFAYNTCKDRDGDGLIKTSTGIGHVLPWTNANGADTDGGVSTAEDECIINYTRVIGTGARALAVDSNNDVWVGGFGNTAHEKIDGSTGTPTSGLPIPGTQFTLGCGGYGALMDKQGVLWSSRGGGGLLRYDPTTIPPTGNCLRDYDTHSTFSSGYGLGIDPHTGHVWHSVHNPNSTTYPSGQVMELNHDGSVRNIYPHGYWAAQGVAVDGSSNVWVAHVLWGDTTVGHLRTDGTFVGNVDVGGKPTGVAVDANGKIWASVYTSNRAVRIDPRIGSPGGGGFPVGAVDLTVYMGTGASPYNYSDMTGFTAITDITYPGSWTVLHDAMTSCPSRVTVTWNGEPQGSEPAGSTIAFRARASGSKDGLAAQAFVNVSNGVSLKLSGRWIEVEASMSAALFRKSPVLSDVRIQTSADACYLQPWAFPNPFKPEREYLHIQYELPSDADMRISLYGPDGGQVRTLKFGRGSKGGRAGLNDIVWDGRDAQSRRVPSGTYTVTLEGGALTTDFRSLMRIGVR